MQAKEFLSILDNKILIGDGAMGTYIYAKGIPLGRSYEELNISNPHLIKFIHKEYIQAGAELIETNTFQANRLRLAKHELEKKVRDINIRGTQIAREISGKSIIVAGSVGPITGARKEYDISINERYDVYGEQIQALAEGGCDVLMLETFTDLDDLKSAFKAARDKTDLAVICQMAFLENQKTPLGIGVEQALRELEKAGADVIGVNCGVGPHYTFKTIDQMGSLTKAKLSCFPNAGLPEYVDGRYMYLTTPEYMADMARQMVNAGINIIGGCCGTDPSHIKAIATRLKNTRPVPRRVLLKTRVVVKPEKAVEKPPIKKTFFDKIGKEAVIVVELDPPRTLEFEKSLKGAKKLKEAGVDAITVGDNPLAILRMGNLAFSYFIEQQGIQTIAHMSCRDRNLIALQSSIMEAAAFSITSILAITGDPAKVGDQPTASSVFDINSIELIQLIHSMNQGKNYQGNDLKKSTNFVIGCAFNPNKQRIDQEISRLKKKIDAGAQFALPQPCYDKKKIEEVYNKLKEQAPDFPVFFGFLPPLNAKNAEFLANEVPGITIPEEIIHRIKSVPEGRQMEEGFKITKELIEFASNFTQAFYMILPFSRVEAGCEFIRFVKTCPAIVNSVNSMVKFKMS